MWSEVKIVFEETSIPECITYTFGDSKKIIESTKWVDVAAKHTYYVLLIKTLKNLITYVSIKCRERI